MDKNKRFWIGLCTALGSLLLITGLLIASIEMFAINAGYFKSEYAKLGTAQNIGMSEDDLEKTTQKLLDYTTDADDDLIIEADIQGETQAVFGQREIDHMVDVKALYLGARNVRTAALIGAAVLIALAFVLGRKETWLVWCKSFLRVSGAFVVLVAVIGLYAALDFSAFWTSFHRLFFTNDLWLLDPATDILIQMVPEQFFSDLVGHIIIRFVSIFLTLNVAAIVGGVLFRRRSKAIKGA